MGKRPTVTDAAATAEATDAAATAEAEAAPALPIELTPEAEAVLRLKSALEGTPEAAPYRATLEAALAEAEAAQAAALDAVALLVERQTEESNALAAAAAFNLSDAVLDNMLAAIDAKYAPAPTPVDLTPEAAPTAGAGSRGKQPSANTLAKNAAVAEALLTDDTLLARVNACVSGFYRVDTAYVDGVHPAAGTRFAALVTLSSAGAGVANYADFETLSRGVRLALLSRGLSDGGKSAADFPWCTATGIHAPDRSKSADTLASKFTDRRSLALYPDGLFRLAAPSTADVRFIRSDAAAFKLFAGSSAAAVASAAAPAPDAPAKSAIAPTAPNSIALPSGGLARTARCQHCQTRNIVGDEKCAVCAAPDWRVE